MVGGNCSVIHVIENNERNGIVTILFDSYNTINGRFYLRKNADFHRCNEHYLLVAKTVEKNQQ